MACKGVPLPGNQLNEILYIPLSAGRYGGYKTQILKQILSPIEKKCILCSSCAGIMTNASFSAGEIMCESCCPESVQSSPVKSVREIVSKLLCKCPFASKGCLWYGIIEELDIHLGVCELVMVPCPCANAGCDVGLLERFELQLHMKDFMAEHLMLNFMQVEKEENKKKYGEAAGFLGDRNRRLYMQDNQPYLDMKKRLTKFKADALSDGCVEAYLLHTFHGKELKGVQFKVENIQEKAGSDTISKGSMFYLERYKIQIHLKLTTALCLYIMRIHGKYDMDFEMREATVGLCAYQIIDSENSKVMFRKSKNLDHPLDIDRMSPQISNLSLDKYVINDSLTVRVFFEISFI